MPHRLTANARFPRVVGFVVPAGEADGGRAPIVALLDVAPTEQWATVFLREASEHPTFAGLAVTADAGQLSFTGPVGDPRLFADKVRAMVERISMVRLAERLGEPDMVASASADDDAPPS